MSGEPSELDRLLGAARRRQRRRWPSLILLSVAVAAAVLLLARFFYGTSSPYYTVPVVRGDITPQLVLRGTLHGDGEVTLTAARDGTVIAVPDPAVAKLAAGQDLVTLDAIAAQRALDTDSADAVIAKDAVERARLTLQQARQRLDRYENVWNRSGRRVPSLNEMENARGDVARAEAGLADAQARQTAAEQKLAGDRADLESAVARAPFPAYLVGCQVRAGQMVRAGQPLCTVVAHPEQLSVSVPMSIADSARLPAEAMARVLVDRRVDTEFPARLIRIDRAQDDQAQRAIAVFALLPPEDGQIVRMPVPGRDVNVRITMPEHKDVLLVPDIALGFTPHDGEKNDKSPGVYVLTEGDDAPRFVPVALGLSDGRRSEIVSGDLKPGDQVIIGWRREGEAMTAGFGQGK